MIETYDKWSGFIPIIGGIYGLLLAYKVVPRNPKDPEKMELWHSKFGNLLKILSPLVIIFGILELMGVFRLH
jgi:hypothetical protein